MKCFNNIISVLVCSFLLLTSCKEESKNTLQASVESISIAADGGTSAFSLTTNADAWKIDNSAPDWVTLSISSGTTTEAMVSVSVSTKTIEVRTATLTISAGSAKPVVITIEQASSEYLYSLSSNVTAMTIKMAGSSSSFNIITTAPEWTVSSSADWLTFDKTTGTTTSATIKATGIANDTESSRTATITISAQYAPSATITVTQTGPLYPSYNTSPVAADLTGVESTSFTLLKKIKLGWNLGNSMEVPYDETAWGNPKTTQSIIDKVKALGFNAVRIPCAWDSHANKTTAKINDSWLSRVKQVVDYCVNNDMYIVLNIHWDGGWLEENPTYDKQESVNMKQKAYWEQIATYFRDYDEHLMFAGTNEVHENYNTPSQENLIVQMSFNQTFVDAVRSTGGKNAYRNLLIQAYNTNIDYAYSNLVMPTDAPQNRLILETHYYDPTDFSLGASDLSTTIYYWGKEGGYTTGISSYGQEDYVRSQFNKLKTKFVERGYPVIMGEFGAANRVLATTLDTQEKKDKHVASRAYYLSYVTQKMKENGITPFYWDNGSSDKSGMGLFNRNTLVTTDQAGVDALISGADAGVYPF